MKKELNEKEYAERKKRAGIEKAGIYWVVSIFLAVFIYYKVIQMINPIISEVGGIYIIHGLVFTGSIIGAVLYGCIFAEDADYGPLCYLLSAAASVAGVLVLAVILFAFVIIPILIKYLIVIVGICFVLILMKLCGY